MHSERRKRNVLPPSIRFWQKVNKAGRVPSQGIAGGLCWDWTAGKTSAGYGGFHPTKGTMVLAHRFSYESLVGPIPPGLQLDHLCRNRACVNPKHLEAVTPGENTRRGFGISTTNRIKTQCPSGHQYTAENTYVEPSGGRRCRICARERDRRPERNSTLRRKRRTEN